MTAEVCWLKAEIYYRPCFAPSKDRFYSELLCMNVSELISQFGLYAATLIICTVAGTFPVLNTEVYLLSISTLLSKSLGELLAITLLATLGQMVGKSLMFFASQGAIAFSLKQQKYANQIEKVIQKMEKMGNHRNWFIFLSGWVSFPPFFVVTVGSALLKIKFVHFFTFGAAGRFIRFTFCVGVPQLLKEWLLLILRF
jgi:membrane protein YqaA with SNARE-associated domain